MPRNHAGQLDRAVIFLRDLFPLRLHHRPAQAVLDAGALAGISPATLRRAAPLAGIHFTRHGFGPGSRSVWVACRRCPRTPPATNDP